MPIVPEAKKRKILVIILYSVLGLFLFGFLLPKTVDYLFSITGISITQLHYIDANNLLSFWASLFVIGSTLLLALVTLEQNERLMKLEESRLLPFIVVDGVEFTIDKYHQLSLSDRNLCSKMKFVYKNPNAEISFNVKNVSDIYISKIVISSFSISGFISHPNAKPINVFESELLQKSILETALDKGESKNIVFGFENSHNFGYCDLYLVVFTCELIHLTGKRNTSQTIQLQVGNNNGELSIIGKSTFDPESFFSHLSSHS